MTDVQLINNKNGSILCIILLTCIRLLQLSWYLWLQYLKANTDNIFVLCLNIMLFFSFLFLRLVLRVFCLYSNAKRENAIYTQLREQRNKMVGDILCFFTPFYWVVLLLGLSQRHLKSQIISWPTLLSQLFFGRSDTKKIVRDYTVMHEAH